MVNHEKHNENKITGEDLLNVFNVPEENKPEEKKEEKSNEVIDAYSENPEDASKKRLYFEDKKEKIVKRIEEMTDEEKKKNLEKLLAEVIETLEKLPPDPIIKKETEEETIPGDKKPNMIDKKFLKMVLSDKDLANETKIQVPVDLQKRNGHSMKVTETPITKKDEFVLPDILPPLPWEIEAQKEKEDKEKKREEEVQKTKKPFVKKSTTDSIQGVDIKGREEIQLRMEKARATAQKEKERRENIQFEFSKQIKIGTYSSKEELRKIFEPILFPRGILSEMHGVRLTISTFADKMLEKIELSKEEQDLNFVIVTPKELGLYSEQGYQKKTFSFNEILLTAQDFGLDLCPDDTVFYVSLDKDVIKGVGDDELHIGSPSKFKIVKYDVPQVNTDDESNYSEDSKWMFVKR